MLASERRVFRERTSQMVLLKLIEGALTPHGDAGIREVTKETGLSSQRLLAVAAVHYTDELIKELEKNESDETAGDSGQ